LKFKDKELWEEGLANNQDPYGKAIYEFAERWANLMEKQIAKGKKLADIAKQTSHDAAVEGITGFMYVAAVQILSEGWVHGEELRQWHNLDTQIRDEGEKANREGGVLNPTLLSISKKE
jgi:hypothetical protein